MLQRALVRFCSLPHIKGKTHVEDVLISLVRPALRHPLGFEIELDVEDPEERARYFRSTEPETSRFFESALGPGSVFFDCGSHIGFYTLQAAAQGARVVAFEPTPSTFDRLVANVAANGFGEVDCRNVALADTPGRLTIRGFRGSNFGMNTLAETVGLPIGECEVVRLDDLDLPVPTLIKVDVEGSEVALLQGAEQTIRRHRPTIVMEVSGHTAAYFGQTADEVVEAVMDLGNWDVFWLRGRRPRRVAGSDLPHRRVLGEMHGANYVFRPRGG